MVLNIFPYPPIPLISLFFFVVVIADQKGTFLYNNHSWPVAVIGFYVGSAPACATPPLSTM